MPPIQKEAILLRGENTPLLTEEALLFLASLHRKFHKKRHNCLLNRIDYQHLVDRGNLPCFPAETCTIREDPTWKAPPCPKDLEKRWTEITGPAETKMIINALNSGADVFMADFEDAMSPTWKNIIHGQAALVKAIQGTLSYTSPEGKNYSLKEKRATLVVRPRGWHLPENNLHIDGEPISGSLFDFGLYLFHNAKTLIKKGSGPYFYLPKIEHYAEAELWGEVFTFSETTLGLPQGSIRVSVLIETITAAFEMQEIVFALRNWIVALNAGRWDYLFSIIKKFAVTQSPLFPDRNELQMTLPFMKAYTKLLIATCHQRGIHAIGGMAAFIPSRKDMDVNKRAFAKVFEDKRIEAESGFDGAWIAHPDLLPIAREPFHERLQLRPHQIFLKESIYTAQFELLNFSTPGCHLTERESRHDVRVALKYLSAWFSGQGAVAIDNLMEDAATAEISRSHLWQLYHFRNVRFDNGVEMNASLFKRWLQEESQLILHDPLWPEAMKAKLPLAIELLERVVQEYKIPEFITLSAYEILQNSAL